jgi:hypothetical protein
MVREVTAFVSDDGSLHNSKLEALRHDALIALKGNSIFNHASALAIVSNPKEIVDALAPLVHEMALAEESR